MPNLYHTGMGRVNTSAALVKRTCGWRTFHLNMSSEAGGLPEAARQLRKNSLPSVVVWAEMAPSGQDSWQQ